MLKDVLSKSAVRTEARAIRIDELPEPMIKKIRHDVNGRKKEDTRNGTKFWVTELCGCLREEYLWRTSKKDRFIDVNFAWAIWRGKLWDTIWGSVFRQRQGRVVHKIEHGGKTLQISGRFDFIYKDVLGELKTVTSLFYTERGVCPKCNFSAYGRKRVCPHCGTRLTPTIVEKDEHVAQSLFYAAKKGLKQVNLFYADFGKWVRVTFKLTNPDEIIGWFEQRAIVLHEALEKKQVPAAEKCWKCSKEYCAFYEQCKTLQ